MNVGIVTAHLSFDEKGGSNYSIHLLASKLENRGHSVNIYTINYEHENHIPVPHTYQVINDKLQAESFISGTYDLLTKLKSCILPNDVFHVYIPGIIPFVGLYKWRTNDDTPIVATLNGYTTFCTNTAVMGEGCWNNCTLSKKFSHAREGGIDRLSRVPRMAFNDIVGTPLMNQVDEFFCLSPAVKNIYTGVGIDDDLLRVVPNMIDPTFKTAEPIETKDTRILYVGRLEDMKGISILLEAINKMSTTGFHVDIVGDNILNYGPDLKTYRQRTIELGIDDQVTFHGWVDYQDLSKFYAKADLFVHPGLWPEPFGRTIIEAMQHRIPIVCSDVGGPPWICGNAGRSYPKHDSTLLAETLTELVNDNDIREKLSSRSHDELERFNPDKIIDKIESRYFDLVNNQ